MQLIILNYTNESVDIIKHVPDNIDFEAFINSRPRYENQDIAWLATESNLITSYLYDEHRDAMCYETDKKL